MSVKRRAFPESFKREAVDRVANSGRRARAVAREPGLRETRCRPGRRDDRTTQIITSMQIHTCRAADDRIPNQTPRSDNGLAVDSAVF